MPLKPLVLPEDGGTLHCRHAARWPPGHARVGESFVFLRASGQIDENKFQQLQVWERVCGLLSMKAEKCPTCPHALIENANGQLTPLTPPTNKQRSPPYIKVKPYVKPPPKR